MKHAREDYNNRIIDIDGIIPEDEPVFLLRGQDVFAPAALRYWAQLMIDKKQYEMAKLALEHADKMDSWQKEIKHKIADL